MDHPNLNDIRESESDRNEIARFVRLLFLWFVMEAGIVELRAVGPGKRIVSRYFDRDHQNEFIEAAAYWSGIVDAVWFSANPIRRDVCDEALKRRAEVEGKATTNKDIACRRILFIDFDSVKESDESATEAELAVTIEAGEECRDWLRTQGWPEPILAMSGNGCHLYYRIELPNDENTTALVADVLAAIKAHFKNNSRVKVDSTVGNAARMCKLPGTKACKGEATSERPHRIAKLIDVPDEIETVSREQLESLAASVGNRASGHPASASPTNGEMPYGPRMTTFDLEAWLQRNGVAVGQVKEWEGGTLYELDHCPFKPAGHDDGGPRLIQFPDGSISAGCFHNSCQGKGWPEFRAALAPNEQIDPADLQNQSYRVGDDPHRLAKVYRDTRCFHPDHRTLVRWRGGWWQWDGTAWRFLGKEPFEADLVCAVQSEFDRCGISRKVNVSVIRNVEMHLQSLVILGDDVEQPAWLAGDANFPADEMICAENGLFHLPSLAEGKPCFLSPTPSFFTNSALPFAVDVNAPRPALWLEFLSQLWPDDQQSIDTLQEWFGYILTADTSQQKILLVVGPPRSGKGTMTNVMAALIGEKNVCYPNLSQFKEDFKLAPLIGMSLAVVADARLGGRSDTAPIVERLLNISGEDRLNIDRKYGSAYIGKLSTRIAIFSNEMPQFPDSSGALANRMMPLQLTKSFLGNENPNLFRELSKELPGILLWAVEGWKRLRDRGHFDPPASSGEFVRELHEGANPVQSFLRHCCRVCPGLTVPKQELFQAFATWCELQGIEQPGHAGKFGRDLFAALPTLADKQETIPGTGGKKQRVYVGLALRPATEWGQVIE